MDQILILGFENNTPETRSAGRGVMKTLRLMEEEQKQTSLLKSAVRQTRRLQPHPRPVPGVQDPHGPPTPPPIILCSLQLHKQVVFPQNYSTSTMGGG